MGDDRTIEGTMIQGDEPVWEPLVALVGGHQAGWFMWMFEVELADGLRLHAYKHHSTRRYLHLTADGRAYVYVGEQRYREIDPEVVADLVVAGWDPADDP